MGTLGMTENTTTELSQLIGGDGAQQREVTLKASVGDMSRGTVLAMSTTTYMWEQLNISGSNGANVARAILVEDVDDSSSTQKAQAFFIGKYRYEDLIWPSAISRNSRRNAIKELADVGIVIDDDALAETTTSTTSSTSSSTTSSTTTTTGG